MNHTCPLCRSARAVKRESIQGDALSTLYARHGISIGAVPPEILQLECQDCGLGWFDPMFAGPPTLYEDLQRNDWYYDAARPEFAFALRHVKAGMRVLEVGCGEGNFLSRLPGDVTARGLEFNDVSIAKCRARGLNVEKLPVQAMASESPGAYDLVCSFQVLEHVSDPAGFLDACIACLAPGGTLIISVPNDEGPMARMTNAWLNLPPHHVSRWKKSTVEWLARARGLVLVDTMVDEIAPDHRQWIRNQEATRWLAGLFGVRQRVIRNDLAWRLMVLGGMLVGPLTGDRFARGVGHSITAVLRNPAVAAGRP